MLKIRLSYLIVAESMFLQKEDTTYCLHSSVRSLCTLTTERATRGAAIPNAGGLFFRQEIFYCIHRFADIFSQLFHQLLCFSAVEVYR